MFTTSATSSTLKSLLRRGSYALAATLILASSVVSTNVLFPQTVTALGVGDVFVSEVMPDPTAVSDANGEWIELVNNTTAVVDLMGMSIQFLDASSTFVGGTSITGSLLLQPGDAYVICRNTNMALNGGVPCNTVATSMQLNNTGGSVRLLDGGNTLDTFTWGSAITAGRSINAYAPNAATGGIFTEQIETYGAGDFGTPGKAHDMARNVITAPTANATVSGLVDVIGTTVLPGFTSYYNRVTLSPVGSSSQILIGSTPVGGQITTPTTLVSWNTHAYANGDYELTLLNCASAVTTACPSSVSASITIPVTINNVGDPAPSVTFTNPAPNTTLNTSPISVLGTATDLSSNMTEFDLTVTRVSNNFVVLEDNNNPIVNGGSINIIKAFQKTSYPDGLYEFAYTVRDAAGNSTTVTQQNTFGNGAGANAPTVSIVNPVDNSTLSGTINFSANVTDVDGNLASSVFTIRNAANSVVDTNSSAASSGGFVHGFPFNTTLHPDGIYTAEVTATDAGGDTGSTTHTFTINNSSSNPPTLGFNSPSSPTVSGSIVFGGPAADVDGDLDTYSFTLTRVSNSAIVTSAANISFPNGSGFPVGIGVDTTLYPDGDYEMEIIVSDAAGNSVTETRTFTFNNGTASNPPTGSFTAPTPADNATVSGTIAVNYNVADVDGNLTRSVREVFDSSNQLVPNSTVITGHTGSTGIASNGFDTTTVPDGTYKALVTISDRGGDTGTIMRNYTVANNVSQGSAPIVTINNPANNSTHTGGIQVSGTITDADSDAVKEKLTVYRVSDNMIVFNGSEVTFPATGNRAYSSGFNGGALNGQYRIDVTVTDAQGNVTTESVTINVVPPTKVVLSFDNPADNSTVSGAVDIRGTMVDPDDDVTNYRVNIFAMPANTQVYAGPVVPNPSPFTNMSLYMWDTTQVPDGDYVITFSAVDQQLGVAAEQISVTVDNTPNFAPVVPSFNNPSDGDTVSGIVDVRGSLNDPDSNAQSYRMDIFDASSTNIANIGSVPYTGDFNDMSLLAWDTTAFPDGVYTLRLRAIDPNFGAQAVTITVTVSNQTQNMPAPQVHLTWPGYGVTVAGIQDIKGRITNAHEFKFEIIDQSNSVVHDSGWQPFTPSTTSYDQVLDMWHTMNVADGQYTVKLSGRNQAGDIGSDMNTAHVNNNGGGSTGGGNTNNPLHVRVTRPGDNASVNGTIYIHADIMHPQLTEYRGMVKDDNGQTVFDTGWLNTPVASRTDELVGVWNTMYNSDGRYKAIVYGKLSNGTQAEDHHYFHINNGGGNTGGGNTGSGSNNNDAPNVNVTRPNEGQSVSGWNHIHADISDMDLTEYRGTVEDMNGTVIFNTGWLPAPANIRVDELVGEWETMYYQNGTYKAIVYGRDAAGNIGQDSNQFFIQN